VADQALQETRRTDLSVDSASGVTLVNGVRYGPGGSASIEGLSFEISELDPSLRKTDVPATGIVIDVDRSGALLQY
jgi:hypothetical protein